MPSPDIPWDDRVRFAADSAGRYFAYRPNQLIVHESAAKRTRSSQGVSGLGIDCSCAQIGLRYRGNALRA